MYDLLLSSGTETLGHLNLVLLFGVIVLCGTVGARFFQKFNIPQVVGYIVVGILLGDGLDLIKPATVEVLEPFTMFTLGIIGFMIGGELRAEVFKKYGRQFFIILFSQAMAAFVLAGIGSGLVAWFVMRDARIAIAMGLVLGAIASATAPAATVNVLWEFKTRGPLTAAVLAIVALDDALALLLYRVSATGADAIMGLAGDSAWATTFHLLGDIFGAILLGFIAGVMLNFLLKLVRADDKILGFSISSLLLIVGISILFDVDPILPAMTFGVTIANLAPRQSKSIFSLVKNFSPPIYTSFFVLAGAHMEFGKMMPWMFVMILVYAVCRAIGKVLGSWAGARYCKSPPAVCKYLGICLLPQAGVAIGLAILAGQKFDSDLGKIIIMVVMAATFLMEIIGPILVK
ncbi:MAG: cation:proton antiporter, partial [Planctomycetota bacterium]